MARRPPGINIRFPEGQPRVGGTAAPRGGASHSTSPSSGPVATSAPPAPPGAAPPVATSFDPYANPYYSQVLANVNASGAADAASTRAAIQQALIAFGFVPQGFKDKLGALDPTTKALIQKNTDTGISGYARLLEGRGEGIKDLVNRLQSRGLRRSGAKGYGLKKNQLGFDRNFADSVANLLGGVNQQYSNYAQNEFARQQQLASALAWVYQNYYTPPSSPGGPAGPSGSSNTGTDLSGYDTRQGYVPRGTFGIS